MSLELYKDEHPLDPDPIWQAMQQERVADASENGGGTAHPIKFHRLIRPCGMNLEIDTICHLSLGVPLGVC